MPTQTAEAQKIDKKTFVKFLKNLDIQVKTNTKARGHQGFFLKNRIDVSKNLDDKRSIEVLAHEFAHYIHSKIESDMYKTGGSLEKLFDYRDCSLIEKELLRVTDFVDKNSRLMALKKFKSQISKQIKEYQAIIQKDYPNFLRSKKFKEFDKYIKKSNARYLLKYDRVKIISTFLRRQTLLSIDDLETDFRDMPIAFSSYIRLTSMQRKQARVSRRINKLNKYYKRPSELFARFVEGYFSASDKISLIAPMTTNRFLDLLDDGHYFELKELFELTEIV